MPNSADRRCGILIVIYPRLVDSPVDEAGCRGFLKEMAKGQLMADQPLLDHLSCRMWRKYTRVLEVCQDLFYNSNIYIYG